MFHNYNFKNKTVFISGATHGIGLQCLLDFAKMGANVTTFSRDKKKIDSTRNKLVNFKGNHLIEEGDILDKDFAHSFSKKVLKKFKSVDILIHNVGGGGRWGKKDILKSPDNVWQEVYDKNNKGLIIFNKYFLPGMLKKKWGRVIAIASVNGFEAKEVDRPWFNGAKAAQLAIMKSLSKKKMYTKSNITFNSISPGPILIKDTGWHDEKIKKPLKFKKFVETQIFTKKIGTPKDVSPLCIFLASELTAYINGCNIVVDGGVSQKI